MTRGRPPSRSSSLVCILRLKGAFCVECQGLPEPESAQGWGCFVPEPRGEPPKCLLMLE